MHLVGALTEPKRQSLHSWAGGSFAETSWNDVVADAHRVAVGLRRLGVGPGVRVATVLTNSPAVVRGLLGVWLAGGVVSSLPVPARAMGIEVYADQIATLSSHASSPVLLLEPRLIEALRDPLGGRCDMRAWDSLAADGPLDPSPPEGDELALIQYSSGSTSTPKGCALTARAIGNQIDTLAEMVSAVPGEDRVGSWLPLSHDMGLFGCLLFPWACDLALALSTPERFMYDPRTWFGDWADFGATLSAGPPSALQVATRAQSSSRLSRELRMRACVIGAERIAWPVLDGATRALSPYGLGARAWMPAYGMAETTLAISAVALDEEPSCRHVDSSALADGDIRELADGAEAATPIVSAGRPCAGVEVRLERSDRLSEINVRSTSLADGYFGEPEKTSERFIDGELATRDLGFVRDGELYVVGRSDDVLSLAGRKVYAREIEATVDLLEQVRSGCSTIVDVGGEEHRRLVMLIELKDERADCRGLAAEVSRTAKVKAGVLLDECIFLQRGALPKTPTGKIQRFRCRHLVASDGLEPLARVALRVKGAPRFRAREPRPAPAPVEAA
ncbi:MAG TPA: AMP-binding protein [Thermoleophilaceae bacterium]